LCVFVEPLPLARPLSASPDFVFIIEIMTATFEPTHGFQIPSYLLRQVRREALIYFVVMVFLHTAMASFQVYAPVCAFLPSPGADSDMFNGRRR
jgi:hypothetical protein